MKKIIIVNAGSASKKYAVYEKGNEIFRAHFERGDKGFIVTEYAHEAHNTRAITDEDYRGSAEQFLSDCIDKDILTIDTIAVVGFRVVAPGEYFNTPRIIDAMYRTRLQAAYDIAPIHVRAVADEIDAFSALVPQVPFVGVSDSAFHATIPACARLYALPIEDSRAFGIYRYGYHGISLTSALNAVEHLAGSIPARIVICHLGSGASVTAIRDGASIDTSMGFTPLEGVAMTTRVGDIDPGAIIHLGKAKGMSFDALDEYLNHQCGLRGISGGIEGGVRELVAHHEKGDDNATHALDVFTYRIKKYVGAYIAALGGCDMVVFTGTIGERSSFIRARVCEGLSALGIVCDEEKNVAIAGDANGYINEENTAVKIVVVRADEMKQIAQEAASFA